MQNQFREGRDALLPEESRMLEAFGFDAEIGQQLRGLEGAPPNTAPARVIFESREQYRVITPRGERAARPAGKLRLGDRLPAVGDWVVVDGDSGEDGHLIIHALLPSRTCLSRKVAGDTTREQVVAANIDTVFLVMGLDGDFNLRRLERFTVMAWDSGANPVVVLTKGDLAADTLGAQMDAKDAAPGVPVHVVSSIQGEGLQPLRAYLGAGKTVALVGSSGVGKSTLLNALFGEEVMVTGATRAGDDRGRHTTTHRQLVLLPALDGDPRGGGLLVDNPGVREIQLWADENALAEAFDDVEALALKCRFTDCSHGDEPGCAVLAALESGALAADRFASWQGLEKELRHLETKKDVATRRREDRKLSKLYKSIQRQKKARRR